MSWMKYLKKYFNDSLDNFKTLSIEIPWTFQFFSGGRIIFSAENKKTQKNSFLRAFNELVYWLYYKFDKNIYHVLTLKLSEASKLSFLD